MDSVLTWDVVMHQVAGARSKGLMISNFFIDEKRMSRWCNAGELIYKEYADTLFLVRRQNNFSNLYFLTSSVDALGHDLTEFLKECGWGCHLVVDVVGPDASRSPIENVFKTSGFWERTILRRMSRRTPSEVFGCADGVVVAQGEDIDTIYNLLQDNFIAEEEQLPDRVGVGDWIGDGHVLVSRNDDSGAINGFVIFDISPASLYLRYWFVIPIARGMGIGGRLLRSMFAIGNGTKRQYFWVKTDNKNAIMRYGHYGFEFEKIKDVILEYKTTCCKSRGQED